MARSCAVVRPLLRFAAAVWRGRSAWFMVRFATAGAGGLVVSSLGMSILYGLGHLTLPLASGVSSELAIIANYLLNERWTFTGGLPSWTRFAKFNVVAVAGLALAALGVWGLVEYLKMQYLLANVVASMASGALSFGVTIRWIWGRSTR
jgi:putative flippase GtrA